MAKNNLPRPLDFEYPAHDCVDHPTLPCPRIVASMRQTEGTMYNRFKVYYEVIEWDGDGGTAFATTVEEAEASRTGAKSYVVAVENGKRRALNEEEERRRRKKDKMDTTRLRVGQNIYMRSGIVGDWAEVVEVTSKGVIVESDPAYGSALFRFDKNGTACDSSDLCNDKGIRGGPMVPDQSGAKGPWKLYFSWCDKER